MKFGDINIDKTMMPSFQIGQSYPTRRYSFFQDTINGALAKQAQLQNPQNGVNTQPVGAVGNQPNVWSNK